MEISGGKSAHERELREEIRSLTSRSRFFDQDVQTNKLSSFRLIERAPRIVAALVRQVTANEASLKEGGEASLDEQGFLFLKNLEELLG